MGKDYSNLFVMYLQTFLLMLVDLPGEWGVKKDEFSCGGGKFIT